MSNNNPAETGPAVLFVCTGNICRSPTAEAALLQAAKDHGDNFANLTCASAGIHGYHVGEPADERAIAVAARHGIDMRAHRARQVMRDDFYDFDLIVALDRGHLRQLERMAPGDGTADLRMFMDFAAADVADVPDPYYGDIEDFEAMMVLIRDGVDGILAALKR